MNSVRRRFVRSLVLIAAIAAPVGRAVAGSDTDFFRAVNVDDVDAVRDLLARGFDPNAVDSKGNSALYLALRYQSLKVARLLIDDPHIHLDQLNPAGENALMIASLQGDLDIVKLMVAKGAEINKPGWTPLAYAASKGHTDVVRFLLDHSAYIDAAAPNGTTPLMMAAYFGYGSTVDALLDAGADPRLKNAFGYNAANLAMQRGHADIAKTIARAMAKDRPAGW